MNVRGWYEAGALMADMTTRSHLMIGSSEKEIEKRIRDLYPDAVVVLAYRQKSTEASRETRR